MTEHIFGSITNQKQTIRFQSFETLNTAAPDIGIFIPVLILCRLPRFIVLTTFPVKVQLNLLQVFFVKSQYCNIAWSKPFVPQTFNLFRDSFT